MYEVIGQVKHPYGWTCNVVVTGKFPSGLYRIDLIDAGDGEPVGQVGMNLDVPYLESWIEDHDGDYTFIKDYAEHKGMLSRLAGAGLVKMTGIVAPSGFVELSLVEIVWPQKED